MFATVGNVDFNFPEVTRLDDALAAAGYPHFVRYFDGPHQWAPSEVAEEALAWFRLVAMKKDLAPLDADFITQQRDAEIARAKSFEQSGNPFYAWREYNQAIATFDGLIDVAALRAAASTLASQKEVREGRKRQQHEFEDQLYFSADIVETMASLPTLTSDVAATVAATKHKIAILRETAAREKKPDVIILDLQMPAVDGFTVLQQLGADERTSGIPIVVSTSMTIDDALRARLPEHIRLISKNAISRESVSLFLRDAVQSSE